MLRTAFVPLTFFFLASGCGEADGTDNDSGVVDAAPTVDAESAEDATASDCGQSGTGLVTGTIAGAEVSPVMSAGYRRVTADINALIITESADACGDSTGDSLVLLFCDEVEVGSYDVLDSELFTGMACPGEKSVFALAEDGNGSDIDDGMSGMVEVTDTASCRTGSFNLTFAAGDVVTGNFDAIVCP